MPTIKEITTSLEMALTLVEGPAAGGLAFHSIVADGSLPCDIPGARPGAGLGPASGEAEAHEIGVWSGPEAQDEADPHSEQLWTTERPWDDDDDDDADGPPGALPSISPEGEEEESEGPRALPAISPEREEEGSEGPRALRAPPVVPPTIGQEDNKEESEGGDSGRRRTSAASTAANSWWRRTPPEGRGGSGSTSSSSSSSGARGGHELGKEGGGRSTALKGALGSMGLGRVARALPSFRPQRAARVGPAP